MTKYEARYDQIMVKAKEAYEYIPATEYYKEGYNLRAEWRNTEKTISRSFTTSRCQSTTTKLERLREGTNVKTEAGRDIPEFRKIDYLCQCYEHTVAMRQKEDVEFI